MRTHWYENGMIGWVLVGLVFTLSKLWSITTALLIFMVMRWSAPPPTADVVYVVSPQAVQTPFQERLIATGIAARLFPGSTVHECRVENGDLVVCDRQDAKTGYPRHAAVCGVHPNHADCLIAQDDPTLAPGDDGGRVIRF
jgi:hypothetical protein